MANRRFEKGGLSCECDSVTLWAVVTISGTSGAPTLTRGEGITSVTRSATGQYYLTLADKYSYFLGGTITPMRASTYSVINCQFEDQNVAGATLSAGRAGSKQVMFACYDSASGTSFIDPMDGVILYITLNVRNSSVA